MSRHWKKADPSNERGRTAIRYRAYPTVEQVELARRIGGSCRLVKNLAKEQRDLAVQFHVKNNPGYVTQVANLKELRDDPSVAPFLKGTPSQILQQALRDTDQAYRRFFRKEAKYPNWTKRGSGYSFRIPQHVQFRSISDRFGEVRLQGLKWVRVRVHRPVAGSKIKSATYVEEPDGKVFISLLIERHHRQPTKSKTGDSSFATAVGVDRGVVVAAATSDGDLMNRDIWRPKEKERLKCLQQSKARKIEARRIENIRRAKFGKETLRKSRNEERIDQGIASMYARSRRRRKDFCEQVSTSLAKNHSLIVFEDLKIDNMTASAKGTTEEPGRNVAQKAGLDRAILDKGWGMLKTRTECKVKRYGHSTLDVPAPYTSLTCPVPSCGYASKSNRVNRDLFVCEHCGHSGHADTVAAKNILGRGIELVFAGGVPVEASQGTTTLGPQVKTCGVEPSSLDRLGNRNNRRTTSLVGWSHA
ncbi:MAG: RNA-guided endonuclease InsQ/TnpB family protein [Acidimicrobiales bacterium]